MEEGEKQGREEAVVHLRGTRSGEEPRRLRNRENRGERISEAKRREG